MHCESEQTDSNEPKKLLSAPVIAADLGIQPKAVMNEIAEPYRSDQHEQADGDPGQEHQDIDGDNAQDPAHIGLRC